ncbi:MAG: procyclic acidic repetitive family protein [Bdellovibrionales bacterium]|nr:procyclic acidic repetitive family protein [Bdellovibrionales bacterium]
MTPIRLAFLITCILTLGLCRGVWAETPPTAPSEEEVPVPAKESAENQAPSTEMQPEVVPAPTSEAALAPQPEQTPNADQAEQTEKPPVKRAKKDYSVPFYQQKRPNWALEISAAARSGLGNLSSISSADPSGIRSFQIQGEFQPQWFQLLGVLGIGGSGALYLTSPTNAVTQSLAGLLSYGYQARYQARWIRNQWVVPFVGYRGKVLRYQLKNDLAGTLSTQGVFYGGMILLSALDEASAAEMYANMGVSRVYLLAEASSLEGSDSNITLKGSTYFFGLRFEF